MAVRWYLWLKDSVRSDDIYKMEEVPLRRENGEFLYVLDDGDDLVPPTLEPFITKVTVRGGFLMAAKRECGVYIIRGARATLRPGNRDDDRYCLISLKAHTVEAARRLFRRIERGDIRPTESFEGAQGGPSRKDLEQRLAEVERELALSLGREKFQDQRERELEKIVLHTRDTVSGLLDRYWPSHSRFPFTRKATIRKELGRISQGLYPELKGRVSED